MLKMNSSMRSSASWATSLIGSTHSLILSSYMHFESAPFRKRRIHFSSFCSSFTWPSTSPNREASYTTNLLNFSRKNVTLLSAISFFTTLLSLGANKRQRKPLCSKEKEDDLFGLHSPGFSSLRMKEWEAFFLSQFFPLMTNNGDPFLLRRGTSSCPFLYSNTKLHSQLHTNSILNTVFNRIRYRSNHTKSSAKKFLYSLTFSRLGKSRNVFIHIGWKYLK